jgi:hypothetical protein
VVSRNTLTVPSDATVRFSLTSLDVIHSGPDRGLISIHLAIIMRQKHSQFPVPGGMRTT